VIGGSSFSKSFLGYTSFKVQFRRARRAVDGIALMLLPFAIFVVL